MSRPSAQAVWAVFVLSLIGALVLQLIALPDSLSAARPLWLPLMLAYWALREPQLPALVPAFITGLMLDVLYASPLGQHALGLVVVVYLVVRLRSFFIIFPLWQATVALIPAWALYCFLMFWIDGATRHEAEVWLRWLPAISTTLFWPLLWSVMELIRQPGGDDD
ncbi:MAG TPA: rod shape-determining protein MreD [Solimonas sp.]|nr:rod shape-determining protein MreD [Solimonas sp.]